MVFEGRPEASSRVACHAAAPVEVGCQPPLVARVAVRHGPACARNRTGNSSSPLSRRDRKTVPRRRGGMPVVVVAPGGKRRRDDIFVAAPRLALRGAQGRCSRK